MTSLPSYGEATAVADWLQLVSPYCRFEDHHALRLVSRHFHHVFSPLLWKDLFRAVRRSGLDPGDDLRWFLPFVYGKLGLFSASSRALVRILDARQFGKNAYESWSDQHERALSKAFERALTLLPNVNAVLLDGHRDLHLSFLTGRHERRRFGNIQVLSMAECRHQVPRVFFTAPSLQRVVYLDVSYLPGSLLPLLQPTVLPSLRILKVRGRELQDSQCLELITHLRRRLWSLDISENNITDGAIQPLKDWCIPSWSFRTEANRSVEGRVLSASGGTEFYGPFLSMEDGELSGSFSHPERYYVDAPRYMAQSTSAGQDYEQAMSDGSTQIRQDTAEAAVTILTADHGQARGQEEYRRSAGLTHLRLSHNAVSAVGVQKLLHISDGHIEDLTCDSPRLLPKVGQHGKFWPPNTSLRGILGAAHCFRPAMSRNLRVLRLHHSVVTNIATLHMNVASYKARSLLAETVIRERIETLFPQTFIPDMNPRLNSLTLTCLPRCSSGPLISKLIQFLKLLSVQEGAIQDVSRTPSTRHSPKLLRGLRHLRLEFDTDDIMDDDSAAFFSLDAEYLAHRSDDMFSFFDQERVKSPSSADAVLNSRELGGEGMSRSCWPDRDKPNFVTHCGQWNGEGFSVEVWIGPASDDAPGALRDYRRMVVDHGVRDGVGPATPAQIRAGAPQHAFIYQIAWSAAVMPAALRMPSQGELAGMSGVVEALKAYRLESRARYEQRGGQLARAHRSGHLLEEEDFFWTGVLEVSIDAPVSASLRPHDWVWR
ncbi:hypothetical protein E4U41_000226 [Claviceps citrina]|nr:hypothetical protein E4U41_000226 [Claviceps citrina]